MSQMVACSQDFLKGVHVGSTIVSTVATLSELKNEIKSTDSWGSVLQSASGAVVIGTLQIFILTDSLISGLTSDTCPMVSHDDAFALFNSFCSVLNMIRIHAAHTKRIEKYKWTLEQRNEQLHDTISNVPELISALQNPVAGEVVLSHNAVVGRIFASSSSD